MSPLLSYEFNSTESGRNYSYVTVTVEWRLVAKSIKIRLIPVFFLIVPIFTHVMEIVVLFVSSTWKQASLLPRRDEGNGSETLIMFHHHHVCTKSG